MYMELPIKALSKSPPWPDSKPVAILQLYAPDFRSDLLNSIVTSFLASFGYLSDYSDMSNTIL